MATRELALKLFGYVYGVKTPTAYLVKKQFPKFRASKKDHWEFLVLKLLKIRREMLAKASKENELTEYCRKVELRRMSLEELQNMASSKNLNPNRPRHLLLRDLGYYPEYTSTVREFSTKASRRGVRQWDGRL